MFRAFSFHGLALASDHRMIDLIRDSLFRQLPQRRVINRWI